MDARPQGSPWTRIWVKPKEAIEQLKSRPPTYMWWVFAFIFSLNTHVRIAALPGTLGPGLMIAFSLISIAITTCITWCLFYIGAFILWRVSGWFKGKVSFDDSKRLYVWSRIPFLVTSILIAIVSFSSIVRQGHSGDVADAPGAGMAFPGLVSLIILVGIVWWLFIYIKGLMHLNCFGAARAWAALIITSVFNLIVLLFVMFIFALLIGAILGILN